LFVGGFVPREPPYYDVPYRSTDLNLEIGTGVTVVPQITNLHKKNNGIYFRLIANYPDRLNSSIVTISLIGLFCRTRFIE